MDLRNWEFYEEGPALVGAQVFVREATVTHPNNGTILASTNTNAFGMWTFVGLSNTPKDVEVIWGNTSQYHRWYKGMTQHNVDSIFISTLGTNIIGRGALGSRPTAGHAGRLYFVTDAGVQRLQRDNGTSWDDLLSNLSQHPSTVTAVHTNLSGAIQNLSNGAWTKVIFPTETLDTLNEYDPSTGFWTPQVSGQYLVEFKVLHETALAAGAFYIHSLWRFVSSALHTEQKRFYADTRPNTGAFLGGGAGIYTATAGHVYAPAIYVNLAGQTVPIYGPEISNFSIRRMI